jgi:hypothetical protein
MKAVSFKSGVVGRPVDIRPFLRQFPTLKQLWLHGKTDWLVMADAFKSWAKH